MSGAPAGGCPNPWPHRPFDAETDGHGHDHRHEGDHGREHGLEGFVHRGAARRSLLLTMALTGSMMVVEAIGGWLSGSLALLSDAGHMLTHFLALSVSWLAIRLAAARARARFSFGLYRAEVLAALFNAATLLAITAYIFYESAVRLLHPEPIQTTQMFAVGLAGLLVNLVSAYVLHGQEDIGTRSAFLHMLGDLGGSVAVVLGALAIRWTGWTFVDPMLSALIGCLILKWAWDLVRESALVLMESAPPSADPGRVAAFLRERFPEVLDVHDVHVWEITSKMYALTAHLVVGDRPVSASAPLLHAVQHALAEEFEIGHVSLQLEAPAQAR